MRIDRECVNQNTLLLIEEIVQGYWAVSDTEDLSEAKSALGEINGALRLAEKLKEVIAI